MMKQNANPAAIESVVVTIFNQTYSLRSPGGDERLRRIARQVDERMRQISAQITTHDVSKIAILAALNIADELQNTRDYYEQELQNLLSREAGQATAKIEEKAGEPAAARPTSGPNEGASWFDAIFDAEAPPARNRERLSSKISAKLQSLRDAEQQAIIIESEDGP